MTEQSSVPVDAAAQAGPDVGEPDGDGIDSGLRGLPSDATEADVEALLRTLVCPTPRTAVVGLPRWADSRPGNAELVATIAALDLLRNARGDVAYRLTLAQAGRASAKHVQDLGGLLADLTTMIEYAEGKHIVDGVALLITHDCLAGERLQVSSTARDVRGYVEAERRADSAWVLHMGDLDSRADVQVRSVTGEVDEVTRVAVEFVLGMARGGSVRPNRSSDE